MLDLSISTSDLRVSYCRCRGARGECNLLDSVLELMSLKVAHDANYSPIMVVPVRDILTMIVH